MATLKYADDDLYEVELFDHVEIKCAETGRYSYMGMVTKIFPRKRSIRVRYEDPWDVTRRTSSARMKSAVVPIACAVLMERDG